MPQDNREKDRNRNTVPNRGTNTGNYLTTNPANQQRITTGTTTPAGTRTGEYGQGQGTTMTVNTGTGMNARTGTKNTAETGPAGTQRTRTYGGPLDRFEQEVAEEIGIGTGRLRDRYRNTGRSVGTTDPTDRKHPSR
ncbi:MAG: hypothetical protein AB1331_07360 [Bacillota bacterium]